MYTDPIIDSSWFDNCARDYKHIQVKPYASSMGAEIIGTDVRSISDDAFVELEDALFRHKMIFMREQQLTREDHEVFTSRFGPVATDAYDDQSMDDRKVTTVIKEADQKAPFLFGGGWHLDSPFMEEPPAITILRSVETPPYGGDTMWANTALAYRALSETMKRMIDPLRVYMSAEDTIRRIERAMKIPREFRSTEAEAQAMHGVYQPLVRSHPKTGEKSLNVSGGYTCGFEGLTEFEADYLVEFLMAHTIRHSFTCRLRWEPNMLALWDNRSCLHFAMNDYDGFRREMYRSMVRGQAPT